MRSLQKNAYVHDFLLESYPSWNWEEMQEYQIRTVAVWSGNELGSIKGRFFLQYLSFAWLAALMPFSFLALT